MTYRIVDSYPRREFFDYFRRYRTPFWSLTFRLDMTELKEYSERHGHSVYLDLCYYFTRAAAEIEEFRYRVRDGQIVLYDRLDVAATLPAPDGLFSFAYFEYVADTEEFHRRADEVSRAARRQATLAESEHSNHLLFTALPWVSFTGFAHAKPDDTTDARPRVAFGRFSDTDGRLEVPVGLEVNHIFVDGAAVGRLVERAQALFEDPR